MPFAVIAGVGAGTGRSVALKFAKAYPIALLARNPDNYKDIVEEINSSGGKAIGISTDVSDSVSVKAAFKQIEQELGGSCSAAIFNASGGFRRAPFLDTDENTFVNAMSVSCFGAFHFSQQSLPFLLKATKEENAPTLIFTGATASVKSNAQMASFSTGKWALRALSHSLAKEFGPQGVHVAHAVIDGVIDIPRTKEYMKDAGPDAKISPDAIADAYWHIHTQPRSCFTNDFDVRPALEKW